MKLLIPLTFYSYVQDSDEIKSRIKPQKGYLQTDDIVAIIRLTEIELTSVRVRAEKNEYYFVNESPFQIAELSQIPHSSRET